MSSLTAALGRSALGRPTLADRLVSRSILTDVMLVAGGAAFTGLLAQIAVPLWPVPITGQTLAVLLVGSTLGALRGMVSLAVYAVLGIAGVPWFSDAAAGWHVVAGPTGGYIIGFIIAAGLTGWLAQRSFDRKVLGAVASFAAGTLVTFAIGLPWLAASLGLTLSQTLEAGLYPFIVGGIVKTLLAAGIIPLAWKLTSRRK
ncbi:biotin transporter BioY [Herbiconiux sp. VKM Ac-2851]|jgi:biotin transport system substrate-specific component|uniref:biotin transporter BioY n=1 Tax=Herbiconiux sp. VKM Ac-2851 TaxID=2739025 RepID=UPI00156410F4|nr:biotin transporter BioY [Herbiconiux sp. VKM Ac-2851]NQX33720.1 biotin transporter BioY [Herbiconiux sp. VKM Ac-2851]